MFFPENKKITALFCENLRVLCGLFYFFICHWSSLQFLLAEQPAGSSARLNRVLSIAMISPRETSLASFGSVFSMPKNCQQPSSSWKTRTIGEFFSKTREVVNTAVFAGTPNFICTFSNKLIFKFFMHPVLLRSRSCSTWSGSRPRACRL